MRFCIFGAGALGQALGCMLAAAGHQVDLLLRERFLAIISEKGLSVSGIFGNYLVRGHQLGLLSDLAKSKGDYDYTLLTTKTYDTAAAARQISELGKRTGWVVSLQNGCGNLEQLAKYLPAECLLGGRVITGFEITSPGTVKITVSADAIHLGAFTSGIIPPQAEQLADIITEAGHPCKAVNDIYQSLFAKLLYNCALNPLGAILGVHYGALGEDPASAKIMNQVIDETFQVITAMGGKTPWASAAAYREVFYQQLLPATYHHRASMLQDLEHRKPTEVEALVGYVTKSGEQYGVATPTCALLADLIKFKENKGLGTRVEVSQAER